MKSAIIGFPRVGKLRELKFASEKYFNGEITEVELYEVGKIIVELIIYHPMISHFMIVCWIRQYY